MPVTVGEFEVVAAPEGAPREAVAAAPGKPALDERQWSRAAQRQRARALRTRCT